jgi:hypothetical protein
MEQRQPDREARIGVSLLLGLAAFVFIALVSFYFHSSAPQMTSGIRDNIASTTR